MTPDTSHGSHALLHADLHQETIKTLSRLLNMESRTLRNKLRNAGFNDNLRGKLSPETVKSIITIINGPFISSTPQKKINQTIKQSNNQTIKQSNNQTIKQSNINFNSYFMSIIYV